MADMPQTMPERLHRKALLALQTADLAAAGRFLAEAFQLDANDPVTLALSAELRLRQNLIEDAFALYVRAVNSAPDVHPYKERLLELAQLGLPLRYSEALACAFAACLRTQDIAPLLESWTGLWLADPRVQAVFGLGERQAFDLANAAFFARPADLEPLLSPLFLAGISTHVVCNPTFEEFVTHIRRQLLDDLGVHRRISRDKYIVLASALSHYALSTDFILNVTPDENTHVEALCRRVEAQSDAVQDPAAIAMLACYRPLYMLNNARGIREAFRQAETLADVMQAQIDEPIALAETTASISSITDIGEGVSAKVQGQYELFPYPRWKSLSKEKHLRDWQNDPGCQKYEGHFRGRRVKILVAGCGTGQETAILGGIFDDAEITAIDLSRTSLAYAAMKAHEHGLHNVQFKQADILRLGALNTRFDYILAMGVLHHLAEPLEGWKILCSRLKPGGLMRIGLYSEMGRRAVVAARDVIAKRGYPPTREGMLGFRRDSPLVLDRAVLLKLAALKDFYTLSMYRDFVFPAQEHRFDLLQIKKMVTDLNLFFEGLHVSPNLLAEYRTMFPDDPDTMSLDNWHRFEEQNPSAFETMYVFWCRKPH